ncbi:class I SAM-dependent methyltransferase [Halomonas sp. 18H]|uniref:class I SAM-dependent methyltransferase n=1 Tax=Halomonas almeriensis TaxID=308163 RepID=UPI002230FB3C|nr:MULTISPECIES: class I SAM-dependent methyltransferase [Halomonas]MCW4151925.1 class I SAM-dependent methyltransferase [Halomonas sp. 18H]MDN3554160.1 class I SAM-dependent methyltransferase [Halomonas almeriensis]
MSNLRDPIALARLAREGRQYWVGESGRVVWSAERACIGPRCEKWFGLHALELSLAPALTDMCPVQHSMSWAPTSEMAESRSTLVCPPDQLALPDNCLDLVVVHHLLEVLPQPHHVLQEAARVTADNGHLVLFGWSPYGTAGCARMRPEWRRHFSAGGRWRSPSQLSDWLAFVDFEAQRVDYCGFRLPGRTGCNGMLETLGRRYNVPLGDAYMMVARRRSQLVKPRQGRLSLPPLGGPALGGVSRLRSSSRRIEE